MAEDCFWTDRVNASCVVEGGGGVFSTLVLEIQAPQYMGVNIAVSNGYLIISDTDADVTGGRGEVYAYEISTGNLAYTFVCPVSNYWDFGLFLAAFGDTVVASSTLHDDSIGVAAAFSLSTGATLRTYTNPNPSGSDVNDQFGYGVSVSAEHVAMGARYEDLGGGFTTGAFYTYGINSNTPALMDTPHLNDYKFGSLSGVSGGVALTFSGNNPLWAFNASTGAVMWSTSGFTPSGYIAANDGTALIYGSDGAFKLYALELDTGNIRWSVAAAGGNNSPAVAGGIAVARSGSTIVSQFNLNTGELLSTLESGRSGESQFGVIIAGDDNYLAISSVAGAGTDKNRIYVYSK